MPFCVTGTSYLRAVCILTALTLVFSFGLHTVDTHHTHPNHVHEHGGDTHGHGALVVISEYGHMADKKSLYLVLLDQLSASIVESMVWFLWCTFLYTLVIFWKQRYRWATQGRCTPVVYLVRLFSRGILHPQTH